MAVPHAPRLGGVEGLAVAVVADGGAVGGVGAAHAVEEAATTGGGDLGGRAPDPAGLGGVDRLAVVVVADGGAVGGVGAAHAR